MEIRLGQSVNLTSMRKTIASRLRMSMDTAVQANHRVRADMTAIENARKRHKAEGSGITIGDMVLKCVCNALVEHPLLNGTWTDKKIEIAEHINLGVAVATEYGLLVPVIHEAENKPIEVISQEVKSLAEKARSRRLSMPEMTGGTFTVSNLGMLGIESFTAVINPPEAAILGVGAIVNTVVSINDEIVVRPMMELSLTYDHRIADGEPAAKFIMEIKRQIESYAI